MASSSRQFMLGLSVHRIIEEDNYIFIYKGMVFKFIPCLFIFLKKWLKLYFIYGNMLKAQNTHAL
jgi:hypothetical protein